MILGAFILGRLSRDVHDAAANVAAYQCVSTFLHVFCEGSSASNVPWSLGRSASGAPVVLAGYEGDIVASVLVCKDSKFYIANV